MTYDIIRQTWLTRPPRPHGRLWVGVALAVVAMGSLIYWMDLGQAMQWMPASASTVYGRGELWRLWTALLAHADIGHFLANSLLFLVLGYFLSGYFGPRVFPGAAFLFGGLTNALSIATYEPQQELIGASGVVSWMGGAWLVLYFLISREKSVGQRVLRAAGVGLLLFAPSETLDPTVHISHRTHLIGFVLGLVYGFFYYQRHRSELLAAEIVEVVEEAPDTGPLDGSPEP